MAIPCNNKAKHSVGLMWYLLAREVLRLRGSISRAQPWSVMVDMFFYRDPEEVEKQAEEQAAEKIEYAAQEWTAEEPAAGEVIISRGINCLIPSDVFLLLVSTCAFSLHVFLVALTLPSLGFTVGRRARCRPGRRQLGRRGGCRGLRGTVEQLGRLDPGGGDERMVDDGVNTLLASD